jgi:hypothetical protein
MNIQATECATHILHNALLPSADILPIDVEAIVNKIFLYFHTHTHTHTQIYIYIYIYMLQVEELKECCDFVDVEYKQILGSVRTKWLLLQPAITIISMFPTLKSYFLYQEKRPTMLRKMFNYPVFIFWIYFLEIQM